MYSHAQEGHLGHDHDKWHKSFYDTLQRPDTKTSCCNLTDCRPTQGRVVGDHYKIKVNGAWISVPANKIVKKSAPDMGFYVCAPFQKKLIVDEIGKWAKVIKFAGAKPD